MTAPDPDRRFALDSLVVVERPIIRETLLARAAYCYGAVFTLGFATIMAIWGSQTSSAPWQYLMHTLGGHWQWVAALAVATSTSLYGVARTCYWCIALGCFLTAVLYMLIGALFLFAPVVDPGVSTLGWYPWMFGIAVGMIVLAVTAVYPLEVV